MFDLKKRKSLPLTCCSHDAEEFRRVAVRRKAADGHTFHTDLSDMCVSYNCRQTFDRVCGSGPKSKLETEEEHKRSSAKRSLYKPQDNLQTPVKSGPQSTNGRKEEHSQNGGHGGFINPTLNCYSPSPVKGRRDSFGNGESQSDTSHARHSWGASNLASSPTLGAQDSANVGIRGCSPKSEGRYRPAKNNNALSRRQRTPSPVYGKMWTYTPAKNSKSWLGLNKISNFKLDGQKSKAKSLSVPDLITFLEDRNCTEIENHAPLKPIQPANSSGPSQMHNVTTKEALPHLSPHGKAQPLGRRNGTVLNGINDQTEEAKIPVVNGDKRFYCTWTESVDITKDNNKEDKEKEKVFLPKEVEDDTKQRLYKIAIELLQTEKAYVARLHLLDQVFCSRLTEEANRGTFPPEVIKNIFSNISSIYSFHSQFLLPDIENCISQWSDNPGLGRVLLQHAPFMRMYADFVRNFDKSMELLRTWTERSSSFRNIIQNIQSQKVCGSLSLQHHMLEPIQRLPRYELLLKDYLKKLPEDNPDYEHAQKSLQTISMATIHSNSAIEKTESLRKLLEIYEMVGEEEVVNPTNEFLKEGRLQKLAARNTSAMERQLFLFNNFLLCCTPKFSLVGQRYTVRCRIGVDGMHVQQTINEGHLFTFQVSGKEKTLELQASSEQDRDEWIKVIREAINVFQKKNETFKMASRELNVEQPAKELGRRAPKWIRDNEVSMCMKCQEPFNPLTRRRHHCRACGCVVCWKCSDNKVALAYDGYKLNKVCKSCYLILTNRRRERRQITYSETSAIASLMSGFLHYSDNPRMVQRVWAVLPRTEPTVLYLYAAPQDVKPHLTIPLLGYTLEDFPLEFQDQAHFCLKQSKMTHSFFCDDTDLKGRWLAVLKAAVRDTVAMCPLTVSESCNDIVNDGTSSSIEDFVIIGDNETQ